MSCPNCSTDVCPQCGEPYRRSKDKDWSRPEAVFAGMWPMLQRYIEGDAGEIELAARLEGYFRRLREADDPTYERGYADGFFDGSDGREPGDIPEHMPDSRRGRSLTVKEYKRLKEKANIAADRGHMRVDPGKRRAIVESTINETLLALGIAVDVDDWPEEAGPWLPYRRTPAPSEDREVGCEREDGLLNIHPESEYCEVCAPAPSGEEGA